ncbi:MAG: DNA primase [Kiritimatiellales bacterium]|nr:DNA primase [Kiritimatiellales bacterium]
MAMIGKEQIEEIRARCNVVEVVGAYLPQLRRRGSTFKCNCPFHQEKTPSFTVNETRQIFHCFGCGAGGDVFRFVMDYEKVDFVTAVKILAERAGVEIQYEGGQPEGGSDKDILYKLHREAAAFYHRLLVEGVEGAEARRYLEERDLPPDMIKAFQIGFAPNEWDGLMKRALKKGYTVEQLEDAGLVVPSERAGQKSSYDRFRNRIMFPICDQMGRVIGFSGRIMNKAEKGAKYVNSPETALFRKNQVLFAFDKARKAIVDARQAIVVEGQIDAIRCHQAGMDNVVASQGTALTENHARLIKRYADEVVLVLDADAAGVKAALASSEIFIATELSVRVVTLPEKEDPDSLIKNSGAEALTSLVKTAPSALDFLIDCLGRQEDMGTEAGRMRIVKAVLNLIGKCPSAARRDPMIHRAADLLNISPQALSQDLRREQRQQRPVSRAAEESVPERQLAKTRPKEEIALLELLVHHYNDVQSLVHDYLPVGCLVDPVCRELVELLMVDHPEALTEGFHDFNEETQRVISSVQVEESRGIDAETLPIELAQRYILLFWQRQLEQEQAALARRTDVTNEERFKESSRIRHDLFALKQGWDRALPMIEARLHSDF